MTNNNQVNWDEIPEDVEAVLTYGITESTFFKKIEDKLYSQCWRHSIYKKSGWDAYSEILNYFGDRFHLRPSPITQPTPVTPESTQVESSEVEDATTPEFGWSSVEEDVEAVVLYPDTPPDFYKYIDGKLYVQFRRDERYFRSDYDAVSEIFGDYDDGRVLISPLTIEPPSILTILQEAQQSILKHHGVTGKVKFTVTCSE